MATSRIISIHVGKGQNAKGSIAKTIGYVRNENKTEGERLISTYECETMMADAEFWFSKQKYQQLTGKSNDKRDVLAYHLRQSFLPGEITPEEALRLGNELAKRFTKGEHAYIVCTHIDKAHIQ